MQLIEFLKKNPRNIPTQKHLAFWVSTQPAFFPSAAFRTWDTSRLLRNSRLVADPLVKVPGYQGAANWINKVIYLLPMKIPGRTSSASTPGKSTENFELFIVSPGLTARILSISRAILLAVSSIPAIPTLGEIRNISVFLCLQTNFGWRPTNPN